ncbi:MAG: alpha-ketoglutarate-dependent dioxygenase AlkB [Actinomycetota bacterium]
MVAVVTPASAHPAAGSTESTDSAGRAPFFGSTGVTPVSPSSMVAQPSLLGLGSPQIDAGFRGAERHDLGKGAWVEYRPGWLAGHQLVFDQLMTDVEWEQHQRPMYDRLVDVPRLTGHLPSPQGDLAVIGDMGAALAERYGCPFPRVGYALYRNGEDSVAWHGDQVARDLHQAIVATVSVGEPRRFALRPKHGGPSQSFMLGHGDLLVMGGTCQRTWDHAIPKVAHAGPRIVIMFRPQWPGT